MRSGHPAHHPALDWLWTQGTPPVTFPGLPSSRQGWRLADVLTTAGTFASHNRLSYGNKADLVLLCLHAACLKHKKRDPAGGKLQHKQLPLTRLR